LRAGPLTDVLDVLNVSGQHGILVLRGRPLVHQLGVEARVEHGVRVALQAEVVLPHPEAVTLHWRLDLALL
jgi:hypothetical protein